MRYIVMAHNEQELERVAKFARENGFDFLSIRSLLVIDAPEQAHRTLIPESPGWRAYRYHGEERIAWDEFVCQTPFWFPAVFADGTVVGCEQDYNAQEPMGTLSGSMTFSSIWHGPRAAEVRQKIRDAAQSLSFCRSCPYAGLSSSHCTIQALPLNPSIPIPTPLPAR
jgi:radical SAM protein with 4Fe4S-binding SPASM domain